MLGTVAVVAVLVAAIAVLGRRASSRGARLAHAERLLAASQEVSHLRSFADAMVAVAREAGSLVRGDSGLCVATGADGRAVGVVASAHEARAMTTDELAAIESLVAASNEPCTVEVGRQPVTIRLALPPAHGLLLAPPSPSAATPLVLGALNGRGSATDLAELHGPAALAVANARLYETLDAAYRDQLDLNRHKSEFVATVSHELRTPVAAIRGAIATVLRYGDRLDDDQRTELLAGVVGHGDRLARIVEDLLVAASSGEPAGVTVEDVDVVGLLADVVAATSAATGGRVVLTLSPVLEKVRTDGDRLRTALVHVVENAAKFAPEGPIELESVAAGRRALFYVTDQGPGIAPEDRERVFQRFVQLDQSITRSQGGLGMGLYVARQLAGLLGGELVLDDAPGGGCSFCLSVSRDLAPAAVLDVTETLPARAPEHR